ncbi:hypothetical protein AB4037_15740 [Labrys sp. KB_33_2]|jgi:hypothetical protein|uniref:hypothetical protein n=1 Tax=Labrys sp. KB_33_2 TaxID=3237479 RepID=UPI003F8DA8D7
MVLIVRLAIATAMLVAMPAAAIAMAEDSDGPTAMLKVGGKAGPLSCWSRPIPCRTASGEPDYCSKPAPCPAGTRTIQLEGGEGKPAIYAGVAPPPIAAADGNHEVMRHAVGRAWKAGRCLVVFGRFTRSGAVAAPLLSVERVVGPCSSPQR